MSDLLDKLNPRQRKVESRAKPRRGPRSMRATRNHWLEMRRTELRQLTFTRHLLGLSEKAYRPKRPCACCGKDSMPWKPGFLLSGARCEIPGR
jgi:hypothetical protein